MVYGEFTEKISDLGFVVELNDMETLICKRCGTGKHVIHISKTLTDNMTINMIAKTPNDTSAIKLAIKLARTPLVDRISHSPRYEIILPHLNTITEDYLCIIKIGEKYHVSTISSNYGKRIFSKRDMLDVPKEYHSFARNIETGEPYMPEGVSL